MAFYTWKEEKDARVMAETQRNNALAKVSELESLNKELKKALSDLLINTTAKARYISLMEGKDGLQDRNGFASFSSAYL